MDKKTVETMLQGAVKKDYIEIISKMTICSADAEQIVLEWCKKNNKDQKDNAYEIELGNLWNEAREVIHEFNCYGGGPEDDEETAADNLWKMDEIVKKHKISWTVRETILDEMLDEFYVGNSGFDDLLIDVAESFCKKKEEKRYLADALAKGDSNYYRGYAVQLYHAIGDEDAFLQTRLDNLRYGTDYIEVAAYYAEKGDSEKELEYIWKGLENSNGRLDELVNYIAPIYREEKNEKELERLYQFILNTQWNINIIAIAKHLYEYSREVGDYGSKKKMLLLILDTCDKNEIKEWFKLCKKELTEEDWQREYVNVLEKVRKKDLTFYLDICMETGKEDVVLEYLQKQDHGYDHWDLDHEQYFSKRLFFKYPQEILSLYWRDVDWLLRVSNNKNYAIAAGILKKIKNLMEQNERADEWKGKFDALKEVHKRKRNFMALIKDI